MDLQFQWHAQKVERATRFVAGWVDDVIAILELSYFSTQPICAAKNEYAKCPFSGTSRGIDEQNAVWMIGQHYARTSSGT